MAISNAEYSAWLKSSLPQYRNILVEVVVTNAGVDSTLYLTQKTYNNYIVCLKGGFNYNEQLSIPTIPTSTSIDTKVMTGSSNFTLSIGDIEVLNTDGRFDYLLDYIWTKRAIKVLIGDLRWSRSDYRTILDGIVNKFDAKDAGTLNIIVQDKLQQLNAPLTETKVGGTVTALKDQIIPFVLGEVCNMSPLKVEELTYTYQVHPGAIERIIEIRDDEWVITTASIDLANGKFTLTQLPHGTLTCSVQGHKPAGGYSDKIGTLIKYVVTQAGGANSQLLLSEVDLTSIAQADALYPQSVGYTNSSNDNILTCIQALAATVGGEVTISRSGLLRIVDLVTRTSVKTITAANMEVNSFHPSQRLDVSGTVTIGYCKNWTVQAPVAILLVPDYHKFLFSKEFLKVTATDSTVITNYKDTSAPVEEDTYLLSLSDATTEANRRLAFRKVQHTVYSFAGDSSCLELELGQTVTVQHKRFGFAAGKLAVVVGLSFNWFSYTVQVSVLV